MTALFQFLFFIAISTPLLAGITAGYGRVGGSKAVFIDNGEIKIAFCQVNQSMNHKMCQEVKRQVQRWVGPCEIYLALEGLPQNPERFLRNNFYLVNEVSEAIVQAAYLKKMAKVGFSHETIDLIKLTKMNGEPIAAVINDPITGSLEIYEPNDLGKVLHLWTAIEVNENLKIEAIKESYAFEPKVTPAGNFLPLDSYNTEVNLIIFNEHHPFLTIPAKLSNGYATLLKKELKNVSVLTCINDAHGYVITPQEWHENRSEANFALGGEKYGCILHDILVEMLNEYLSLLSLRSLN